MKNWNAALQRELDKLLEIVAKETSSDWKPNPFTTEEGHFKKKKAALAESFAKYQERVTHGFEVLLREDPFAKDLFDEKAIKQLLSRSVNDLEHETHNLQELFHLEDASLLEIYRVVRSLHERRLEHDASDLLLFLIAINPLVASFWEALGALERQKSNLQEACLAYLVAYDLNPETFTPLFSCMDVLLQQNEKEKAKAVQHYILDQAKLQHKREIHHQAMSYESQF